MDGCEERFSLFASFEPRNNALFGMRVLDSSDRKKQLKTSLVSHAVDTVFHFMKLSFLPPIYFHFWTTSAEHKNRAVCTMLSIHVFFCCELWQKYVYHVNGPRPFPQRKDTRILDSLHLELSHCMIDYKNNLRMLQLLNNRSTLSQHALLCSIFQELIMSPGYILASYVEGADTKTYPLQKSWWRMWNKSWSFCLDYVLAERQAAVIWLIV